MAEAAARRSIQLLNAASARPAGRVATRGELERTAQLVSTWDTYGWVLFREMDYSEAEPWLRAAWEDSYGAEAGTHFGALLGKEGRAGDAARVLRLAAGGERAGAGSETSAGGPAPANSRLNGRGQALAGEHTFFVPGTAAIPAGLAVFDFDYALTAPPRVTFVSGDARLADAADALRKVDTHTLIPPGSPAHLLRRGELHCLGGANCMVEMFSTRGALTQ